MRKYEVYHFFTYKKITSKDCAIRELVLYDNTKTIDDITVKYLHRSTEKRLAKENYIKENHVYLGDKNTLMRFTDKKGLFGIPVWYCKRQVPLNDGEVTK